MQNLLELQKKNDVKFPNRTGKSHPKDSSHFHVTGTQRDMYHQCVTTLCNTEELVSMRSRWQNWRFIIQYRHH